MIRRKPRCAFDGCGNYANGRLSDSVYCSKACLIADLEKAAGR